MQYLWSLISKKTMHEWMDIANIPIIYQSETFIGRLESVVSNVYNTINEFSCQGSYKCHNTAL